MYIMETWNEEQISKQPALLETDRYNTIGIRMFYVATGYNVTLNVASTVLRNLMDYAAE